MSVVSHLKLGLVFIGIVLFVYGVRVEHERLRWIGIGFLVAAALLRFIERGRRRQPTEPPDR